MKLTQSFKIVTAMAIVFAFLVATNFLYAAWNAPSGAPSAGNNIDTPINVGSTDQVKTGGLSVDALTVTGDAYIQGGVVGTPSGNVSLEIEGKTGASEFCDETGTVCFTAAQARAAIDAAAQFTVYTVFDKDMYWGGAHWFGSDSNQRVSIATASCTAGDYAIAGRDLSFADEISWNNSYTQVQEGYDRLSPTYFDQQGIAWGSVSNATYHTKRVYNGYGRLQSHGSYVGAEVQCLHINN